ncbi:hypothetical protein V8F20_010934, partial [Naviculisporaceae sp. PSN 640]
MSPPRLPIETLPAWALLNGISFTNTKVQEITGKGFGLVCENYHTVDHDSGAESSSTILTVPHDVVLNVAAVEEYAKEDKNFRQLLDAVGYQAPRRTILLFLLVQTALAVRLNEPISEKEGRHSSSVGVSNPWTEYIRFLPKQADLLVPTLWTDDEKSLLMGTSLESAVNAKMTALVSEFDKVREVSSEIPCWNELLWEHETVQFTDWIFLDAIYRSRCLELPRSGESMVPCIDMVNHAGTAANSYYDENSNDEVALLLRPGISISAGEEVTISYGDAKPAAEMLFSYGFIDQTSSSVNESLVVPFDPSIIPDPLTKAKLAAFGEPPKIHVSRTKKSDDEVTVQWECPFAHLMVVNEEDGLEFAVLQDREGNRQLKVFFLEEDVTDRAREFETLIQGHALAKILRLRVVTAVQQCLQNQYERLAANSSLDDDKMTTEDFPFVREECFHAAVALRRIESRILEAAVEELEREKDELLEDENVQSYLGLNANDEDVVTEE